MSEWISVEEQMPPTKGPVDVSTRVLIFKDCGPDSIGSYSVGFTMEGEWHLEESGRLAQSRGYRVTHWMPLPEPPQ